MSDRYILKDKEPVECHSLMEWAKWFENADRIVKQEEIGDVKVSTVFLGLDHSFGNGVPLLFETMIFGGKYDQYQDRCYSWDEAEEMHRHAVAIVKGEAECRRRKQ